MRARAAPPSAAAAAWKVPLSPDVGLTSPRDVDLLDLDAALERLAAIARV